MTHSLDSIVIGGGVVGTACAYYLARAGHKVCLVERSYLAAGSTGRCIGGIRAQFGTETTIRIMQESIRLFQGMKEELGTDIDWYAGGYLFVAESEERKKAFLKVMELQRQLGLDVRFISPEEAARLVPGLNTDGVVGAAYCPTDGQANPFAVTYGYARQVKARGGRVLTDTTIRSIERRNGNSMLATDKNERLSAPVVVAATGPWLKQTAAMVGLDVPVLAERHESLVTEGVGRLFDSMLVDYRGGGCYFHQHVRTGHLVGCYTPVPNVPGDRADSSFEFLCEMPRRMVNLMPKLAPLKVLRQWGGSYEMTPDGSPFVGSTPVEGFYLAGGMCGHGFMLAPAVGKLLAEIITTGKSSIDLAEFAFGRSFRYAELLR